MQIGLHLALALVGHPHLHHPIHHHSSAQKNKCPSRFQECLCRSYLSTPQRVGPLQENIQQTSEERAARGLTRDYALVLV